MSTLDQTDTPRHPNQQVADRIFRGALGFNILLTALWLYSLVTGQSTMFFATYGIDRDGLGRVASGILVFYVLWGLVWWAAKVALLRWFVGFTRDERRDAFSSRMQRPYDVAALTTRYSERRIRIADMIGRRGRFVTLAAAGFYYLYVEVRQNPTDQFALAFLQNNLFDAVAMAWVFLGLYYVNGFVAGLFYGPQSRVMDGVLARANCLLITTLWVVFKFVMVPLGAALAGVYARNEFAVVFALIWGSYLVADASAEIFGSLFGRQSLRVWGVGDVNRKSIVGVVAAFTAGLVFCVWVVAAHGLGGAWYGLSLALAVSNTVLELYSPRGTDDFTMATANALLCLAFGAWIV